MISRVLRFAAAFGVVACLVAVQPAQVGAQTLTDALSQTYQTNPTLQAARAELRAVDERVSQAVAGYRPFLSLDANTGYNGFTNNSGSADLFQNSIGIGITQNIYEGGGTVALIRSTENQVRQQREFLLSTEQSVLLDAVSAYTNVVRDRRVLELAITNESRLDRQRQATLDRFEVGEVTRTDVAQAEARLADAVSEKVAADGDLQISIAQYEQVVGSRPGQLSTTFPRVDTAATLEEALARSDKNPDLLAAEWAVQIADADVRVAEAELLPSVDLSASYDYLTEPSQFNNFQRGGQVTATVTVPLYQSGAEYSVVRQNKQILVQTRRDLQDQRRATIEFTNRAWESLQTANAVARSTQESVRANQIALEGVQTEALVGARTVLDVLDAENELFLAEVDLVDARATEVVALFALQSAMGELTAQALSLDVEIYDPAIYYDEVRNKWIGLSIEGDDEFINDRPAEGRATPVN